MTRFLNKINKYIILLIISSLFGMPWIYLKYFIFSYIEPDSIIESIPMIVDYTIKLLVIILLITDFRKERFKNIVLTCVAAFLYPLLGIIIYAVLVIEKELKASAQHTV